MSEKPQVVERVKKVEGDYSLFLPAETVDAVENLFVIREFDGPTVERRLGIRRTQFERALRHAINRQRDPNGPKAMGRALTSRPLLVRRSA